jgi:putative chitinase
MTIIFDRKTYFDNVRSSLFSGSLSQQQVEGQEAILGEWELPQVGEVSSDNRWLAYMLATAYHETSQKMWPIEEYGKGEGMAYGKPDPETKQTYYGRGYVQLTWRDNYRKATKELGLKGDADLEWHAAMALDPQIAADVMFIGMREGWFRSSSGRPETLYRYFNETTDDAYTAREIINGDKTKVPSWSNGVSIGNLIKGYHQKFLKALQLAQAVAPPEPEPEPEPQPEPDPESGKVIVNIQADPGIEVHVQINGVSVG